MNIPKDQIFVFKYSQLSESWQEIPFQIDDIDSLGDYFEESDKILDENDEIVFMVRDMGDKATYFQWLDDIDSQNYQRYEIEFQYGDDDCNSHWV